MSKNKFNYAGGKEIGLFLLDIFYNAAIIIALVLLIRGFLVSPFRVVGQSMADTLENNEFILIDKLSYLVGDIERGDPIVFLPPIVSSDHPKFEEVIKADIKGQIKLNLSDLEAQKTSEACKKDILKSLWLCKEHVKVGDRIYFTPQNAPSSREVNLENTEAGILGSQDIEKGSIEWSGIANTSYLVRIYNDVGQDYFVKRVIGIPGDTIKIEGGQTYLKKADETDFTQIEQGFLNRHNINNTHMLVHPEQNVFVVPEGEYFVMGDNRERSLDSRSWEDPITQSVTPFVPRKNITGKVFVVLWPFDKIQLIKPANLSDDQ